ncbi:MAG: acyl--CoA ligase [Lachnospiraceae bacterium]|nr:acyl--CoA ligase [Lachnospiraceae bacterium]
MSNKSYPLYEVAQVSNMKELVNHTAEKYGNKPAFIFERKGETIQVSYRQFKSDVDALGMTFFDMGIKETKIAVIGENSYEWILTYLAIVNSGNVIVPIDKEYPAAEVKNLVKHSGTEILVYSETYSDVAKHLRESDTAIRCYISMNSLCELVEQGNALINQGEKSVINYSIENDKLAVLVYTSGTTGNAKGVMLSHKNLSCNAAGLCNLVSFPESFLLILPMHHMFALDAGTLVMLLQGGTIAINNSLKKLPSDMKKYKPRNIFMVPLFVKTFYEQIISMAGEERSKERLVEISKEVFGGNLSTVFCAGAPIDLKYVLGYRELGIEFVEGYGLSEAGAVTSNRNHYYCDNSVGQVLPNCEIKIADPDINGHGEVYVKGVNVMLGYYENEQATSEAFNGEWLKTGDVGYVNEDGFLFVSGRTKNLIVLSSGKKINPEELEFALENNIKYIKEVVVFAEDDTVVAEVFLDIANHPDCASQLNDDILGFNQTQAPYKNINKTVIREIEFPKTSSKKIKRQYK